MTIPITTFVKFDPTTRTFTIKRNQVKLDAQLWSQWFGTTKTKSINTAKKATHSALNQYINSPSFHQNPQKYHKISVNIKYDKLPHLISVFKVFVLSHNQMKVGDIQIFDDWKALTTMKDDVKRFVTFIQNYQPPEGIKPPEYESKEHDSMTPSMHPQTPLPSMLPHSPLPSTTQTNKRKRMSEDAPRTTTSQSTNKGLIATIRTVSMTAIQPLINYAQANNDMLSDIAETMKPINSNIHSRYRHYFQMDIYRIIDYFKTETKELTEDKVKATLKYERERKKSNRWKAKCFRRDRALNRMRKYIGKTKVYTEVKVKCMISTSSTLCSSRDT